MNQSKQKHPGVNYFFRVMKNGQTIDRCSTHSWRRFLRQTRTINWQDGGIKTYLKVSYGKFEDNFGELTDFYNEGDCDNQEDFTMALKAFAEADPT